MKKDKILSALGVAPISGLTAMAGTHFGQSMLAQLTLTGYSFLLPDDYKNKASELLNLAAKKTGKILDTDDGENIWIKTRSGWLSLNPAIICIMKNENDDNEFIAYGFAAEGLISQKTATGAVKKFLRALNNASNLGEEITSKEIVPFSRVDLEE